MACLGLPHLPGALGLSGLVEEAENEVGDKLVSLAASVVERAADGKRIRQRRNLVGEELDLRRTRCSSMAADNLVGEDYGGGRVPWGE